jgi:hypothetical protein
MVTARAQLTRTHLLLGVQSLVAVGVSVNRLSPGTTGYVAANQFLRWVDLGNLLLSLVSVLAFWALLEHVSGPAAAEPGRTGRLGLGFQLGAYLIGVGYGLHELTNYLHARFCASKSGGPICPIIAFHDDGFSHYLFFAGFTLVSAVLMLAQARFAARDRVGPRDLALLALNGVFIAAGIVANLAFEEIGLDLYVVAAVALLALLLLRRFGRRPLLVYYAVGYPLGFLVTVLVRLAS